MNFSNLYFFQFTEKIIRRHVPSTFSRGALPLNQFTCIKYAAADGVADIVLTRPPLNVLNQQMIKEIIAALNAANADVNISVVRVSGEGDRAFSAGVDVGEHLPDKVHETLEHFHKMFHVLTDLEKPTIAVVNGVALGGGCELAMACDLVVASENAKFGQPEIKVGALATVATALLPKLIGRKEALRLLFTGDTISAEEAKELGLVNTVVPSDQLDETVNQLLNKLKEKSAIVLQLLRRAIYQGIDSDFKTALAGVTKIYLKDLIATEDAVEGLRAFLEKRKPKWKGK
jgi:cyclohexa-1,5-dienecarbonyl-CoA hydratase